MESHRRTVVVRYPKGVALAALLVGACALAAQWKGDWHGEYVPVQIVFIALTAYMPLLASFMLNRLTSAGSLVVRIAASPEDTAAWWDRALDSAFGGWRPHALGMGLVAIGIPTIHWSYVPWSGGALLVYYLSAGLLLYSSGVAGWAFLRLLASLQRLSEIRLQVLPFVWPREEIRAIHLKLMQVFIGGLAAYLLTVLGIWQSPGGSWYLANGPVSLWVIPLAFMVVLFFVAIEHSMHLLLESAKQERLRQLSEALQEKFEQWRQSGSKEAAEGVSEILKWLDAVKAERSWPLDVLPALSVIVGVFLPAAKALKELILA